MFLELSEASCWNVFPPHEKARAATLLAALIGSCDPGHVTEENLTAGFGSWVSQGRPTRAWATDLRPEEERRWLLTTSNAWSLPHTRGCTVYRSSDTAWWTDWGHSHRWTHTPTCMLHCMHTVHPKWFSVLCTFQSLQFCVAILQHFIHADQINFYREFTCGGINKCQLGNYPRNKVNCCWFLWNQLSSKWLVLTDPSKHL